MVKSDSNASWSGVTTYTNNAVGGDGGGVYIYDDSNASWDGVTTYTDNFAGGNGGGVCNRDSRVSYTGDTTSTFSGNSAANWVALSVETNSSITFRGNASFDRNSANEKQLMALGTVVLFPFYRALPLRCMGFWRSPGTLPSKEVMCIWKTPPFRGAVRR